MNKPQQSLRFMTTRQAAERLGVSLSTVQLWVEHGVLRAWKTAGGHRRIALEEIDSMVSHQQQAIGRQPGVDHLTDSVVVVEDDRASRELICDVIKSWGLPLDIVTADNGYHGLIEIGRQRPRMVVSDLRMPGMDGFRMVSAMRALEFLRDTVVMVVTSLDDDEIRQSGGLPRDIRVFRKPVDFESFETAVREVLAAPLPELAR